MIEAINPTEVNSLENIAKRIEEAGAAASGVKVPPILVKVKYFSGDTGQLSEREYTYFSEEMLAIGDVVMVPVKDTTGKAKITAIEVPESEIETFRDKVKTIPKGSKMVVQEEPLKEQEKKASTEVTLPILALVESPGVDDLMLQHYAEAQRLADFATHRVIKCLDDVKAATDDLSIIAKLKKAMEERKKGYTSPLYEQVRAINKTYETLMAPVELADQTTRSKILAYNAEQERIRRAQEEINKERMDAAKKEMALKGELSESVNLVEVNPEVPKKVSTEMGTAGMRDNWKYEIVDFKQVPDEYKMVDSAMLNSIAKKHHDQKQVQGIRFYNEPILAVRAR